MTYPRRFTQDEIDRICEMWDREIAALVEMNLDPDSEEDDFFGGFGF